METSTETQIHVNIEGWGRSGCTCERLRDQLRQTVHTGDDDCIDLAQCNAGKGGRRQIVSLSTSQKSVWGGGGGGGGVTGLTLSTVCSYTNDLLSILTPLALLSYLWMNKTSVLTSIHLVSFNTSLCTFALCVQ